MRKTTRIVLIALVASLVPRAGLADDGWSVRWDNGFRFTNPEARIKLKLGGRVMHDWAFFDADSGLESIAGELSDGTEFRRARLFFSGTFRDRVEFKAQYDLAGGEPELKDVYLGLINLPVIGGFRVGHYKEPFSLEELTSSKYITFMERSLPVDAFSPGRNSGFMIGRGTGRVTWRLGLFKDVDEFGDRLADEWQFTGRLTGVPWYAEEGRRVLHLGLSASERSPEGGTVRLRSRPESHLATRFVDTGMLPADGVSLLGLEAALVHGAFSAQGEYARASVDVSAGPEADLDSLYVFVSYFLTGEHRPYGTDDGSFGRVTPRRDRSAGWGAWEIALRYSSVDLDDAGLAGGQLDDWTLGLNWYLRENVRWMLNYVKADLDGVGEADVVQTRFQIDF